MRIKDTLMIQGYVKRSKERSIWRKLVRMMACLVVFCTTYALILPVITLDRVYICGLDVHSHSDQCRAGPEMGTFLCTPESLGNHEHGAECCGPDGVLQCGIADRIIHVHEEICYGPDGQLLCLLPEVPEHFHAEDCFSGKALVCGLSQLTDHIHTQDCLDEAGETVCGLLQTLTHRHDGSCPIQEEPEWACGLSAHTHDDSCVEVRLSFGHAEAGTPATMNLDFTTGDPGNPVSFPDGSTYTCLVGDEVTIRIPDTSFDATYYDPDITVSDCEIISITAPCSQDHSSHIHNTWYGCGFVHEILVRVTGPNAAIQCILPGDVWEESANSVTIVTPDDTSPTEPLNTEPPVTEPQVTEPPVTEPPVTEPPMTEPPVTEPPVTEPPDTEPPVTEPPVTEPPVTEPPVTEPPVTEPPVSAAPLTKLPVSTMAAADENIVRPGYPTAVKTGKSMADTLYFFNFEATSESVLPLAGCVFEIRSTDGTYIRRITSGNTLEVDLPADIPVGNYTITQISAPAGYLRDDNYTRSFSIGISATLDNQKVFQNSSIGSFLNHSLEDVNAGKTAEVENYNNRTYEIILSAAASVRLYEMEPIDVLFVVDQSNSMLFPAGLQPTGKSVRLHSERGDYNNWNLNQANLDRNQVYYVIADPQGTSTVFAIWHDGSRWMYQDASYYAKAFYDNAEGYRQDGETAAFPRRNVDGFQGTWTDRGINYKANGGDLGHALGGSLGTYVTNNGSGNGSDKSISFQLYTAVNQYNRLHYLEESITRAVYQLSDANPENTVTLIRFTKEVDETNCMGPLEMTPENANLLVDAVNKIQTNGGTRQDLALEHAYNHLIGNITYEDGSRYDKYTKDIAHTFTFLITDGAPVRSGSNAPSLDRIYNDITVNANKVKQESLLVTIGLGMGSAERGKEKLIEIASPGYSRLPEDASELTQLLHDLIFSSMSPKQHPAVPGNITDVISDSFYPIAWVYRGAGASTGRQLLYSDDRDWVVLEPGDWIDVNGRYIGPNQTSSAEGQLVQDTNGDLVVRWTNRQLRGNPSWTGRFFVKAKEDFIGGNAIDTNKRANVEIHTSNDSTIIANLELPVPTVNVRLLDLNENSSEVTVYLGDIINEAGDSPYDSLRWFFNHTRFEKLVADFPDRNGLDYGPILNAIDPDAHDSDGLEADSFYLRYALGGNLTDAQWEHLLASEENTVQIDYTYDSASSHGPVGYFTFQVTKNGETADYTSHEATLAGQHVEDYTLHVTYTAYELGESSILNPSVARPDHNVHNGTGSPGTEVSDQSGNGLLEEGYGIVDRDNVHIVNVICGSIEVTKQITPELISDEEQSYSFTAVRQEDGQQWPLEVTIAPGEESGVATIENLPRGTYVLFEHANDVYNLRSLEIGTDTNCFGTVQDATAIFHMGNDPADKNVIGKWPNDRYSSYTASPNGIYGEALFVNEKTIYYGEIPVEKVWAGDTQNYTGTTVHVALYQTGEHGDTLFLDSNGFARILQLDARNGWTGTFRVPLPEKDANLADLGYFVREVTGISGMDNGGTCAILENDGVTYLFFQKVAQEGDLLPFGSRYYLVTYQPDADSGGWTVTNTKTVSLPATGGPGTKAYTFSGLLMLTAATLMFGYSRKRRRERGADS